MNSTTDSAGTPENGEESSWTKVKRKKKREEDPKKEKVKDPLRRKKGLPMPLESLQKKHNVKRSSTATEDVGQPFRYIDGSLVYSQNEKARFASPSPKGPRIQTPCKGLQRSR